MWDCAYTFRRIQKTDMPERLGNHGIGIRSVDAVVLGGDIHRVVFALAGNIHAGNEQRMGVNIAIDGKRVKFAELPRVYVLRRRDLFLHIGAGAGVVVLRRENLRGHKSCEEQQRGREETRAHKQLDSGTDERVPRRRIRMPNKGRILHLKTGREADPEGSVN